MQDTKTRLLSVNLTRYRRSRRVHILGAKICKEAGVRKDLKNRLSKARDAFVKLRKISSSIASQEKRRCGYLRH